jgi:hypothetical protein
MEEKLPPASKKSCLTLVLLGFLAGSALTAGSGLNAALLVLAAIFKAESWRMAIIIGSNRQRKAD